MKVQRILIPETKRIGWMVLDNDLVPVEPICDFLSYMDNIGRSPYTIRSYAYHLKQYWDFVHDNKLDWTNIKLSNLAEFVASLRGIHLKVTYLQGEPSKRMESTVNAILAAVRAFYEYHARNGTAVNVPFQQSLSARGSRFVRYKPFLHHISRGKSFRRSVIKLAVPKRIPKTVTEKQVKILVNGCHLVRDKFLVTLLYETGMRVGQALGLRHSDIRSWDNEIQIIPRPNNINQARTKSLDSNKIPVSQDLMSLYTDYILSELDEIVSDYVFVNLRKGEIGNPMTYISVNKLFERLSRKTGIYIRPHMLRHTHATELIRSGWDLSHVQKRLGHKHFQTTQETYVHLTEEDMKDTYKRYLEARKR